MIKIIVDGSYEGTMNMALDMILAERCLQQKISILRIYEWSFPTLSVGKHQKVDNIDWEFLSKEGIDIVRRPTGGRAVLHKNEFTYSFSTFSSNKNLPSDILGSYKRISHALIESLKNLNIYATLETSKNKCLTKDICYDASSLYEIKVEGKKFIGSAQYRTKNFIIQHGSIPLKIDYDRYVRCFKYSHPDLIKEKIKKTTIDLCTIKNTVISKKELAESFKIGFESVFNEQIIFSLLEIDEIEKANNIKKTFEIHL